MGPVSGVQSQDRGHASKVEGPGLCLEAHRCGRLGLSVGDHQLYTCRPCSLFVLVGSPAVASAAGTFVAGNATQSLAAKAFDEAEFKRQKSISSATTVPGDPGLLPHGAKTHAPPPVPEETQVDSASPSAPELKPNGGGLDENANQGGLNGQPEAPTPPPPRVPAAEGFASPKVVELPDTAEAKLAVFAEEQIPLGYSPSSRKTSSGSQRSCSATTSNSRYDKIYHKFPGFIYIYIELSCWKGINPYHAQ